MYKRFIYGIFRCKECHKIILKYENIFEYWPFCKKCLPIIEQRLLEEEKDNYCPICGKHGVIYDDLCDSCKLAKLKKTEEASK